MEKTYTVIQRPVRVGDDALIMDEIVRVTGLEIDRHDQLVQVIVERQGETFSISPFEVAVEVIEWD